MMFSTSDIGWVVGHSYIIYGPLCYGSTTILFEGKPTYPDCSTYWKIIDEYKPNIFYTSPTALWSLRKEDPDGKFTKDYDLSSIEVVGVVGERTDKYTYDYIDQIFEGKAFYNDTYWQTETGCFISAN